MTKRFSGFIAIFAFFVTCVCGLVADADVQDVLLRALAAMAVFFFLGLLVGAIANRILLDSLFGEEVPIDEGAAEEGEAAAAEPGKARS
jgi:uncharacterized membrane protein